MLDLKAIKARNEKAHHEVSALCHGKRFRMCIPVQPDDSDIVLSEALRDSERMIEALELAYAKGVLPIIVALRDTNMEELTIAVRDYIVKTARKNKSTFSC